ncbi:hypothetical protein Goklo_018453, partial [Gossypium klotzschianum]|nr:hypothetical protein [Gossypium klotzschianum]
SNPAANTVLNNGQTPHNSTAESNACIPAVPDNRNHLKRITCSKTKLQVDIETKYQSGTAIQVHLKETLLFWRAMCPQQKLQKMPLHHVMQSFAPSARMHRVVGEIRARREKQFIRISKAYDFHLEIIYPGLAPRINPTMGSKRN